MILDYCVANWWPFITLWALLYWSDYRLTLIGARLAKAAEHTLVSRGGYELTPQYRKDIAALRGNSKVFYWYLVWGCAYLGLAWSIVTPIKTVPFIYEAFAGMYLWPELMVHMRHMRNVFSFRMIANGKGVTGRIEYSMWYLQRVSAIDDLAQTGLALVLFAMTGRFLFAGGALASLLQARRHWMQSHRDRAAEGNSACAAEKADATPAEDISSTTSSLPTTES